MFDAIKTSLDIVLSSYTFDELLIIAFAILGICCLGFALGVFGTKLYFRLRDRSLERTKEEENEEAVAVLLSGVSGVGKTAVREGLLQAYPSMELSVSHTTRSPRSSEKPGVDYVFVSEEELLNGIQEGKYVEHTCYDGAYYATPLEPLLGKKQLLFEVDAAGQESLIWNLETALERRVRFVRVFLFENNDVIEERLRKRSESSGETDVNITRRLNRNRQDMLHLMKDGNDLPYDLIIRNHDTDQTIDAILALLDV